MIATSDQSFLFLQGPPGPFFRLLGARLERAGAAVHRINLSGGDRCDWRRGSTDFRGRPDDWAEYLGGFLAAHAITDLVLFGDCRPVHRPAIALAVRRGIAVHVFEDGYLRPDWFTLEPGGVNGFSGLPRDGAGVRLAARACPPPRAVPALPGGSARKALHCVRYYFHMLAGRARYRHYRCHRRYPVLADAARWIWHGMARPMRARRAERVAQSLAGRRYVLLALQLSDDFQMRAHSPFRDSADVLDTVLRNFLEHAPPDLHLLVKPHPMDLRLGPLHRAIARVGTRVGLTAGGDLRLLAGEAQGLVTVNSTAALAALDAGTPVKVLGRAIYDMAGLTHQGDLGSFWHAPEPPAPLLLRDFLHVLHARALVHGNLASGAGTRVLVENSAARLLGLAEARAASEGACPSDAPGMALTA